MLTDAEWRLLEWHGVFSDVESAEAAIRYIDNVIKVSEGEEVKDGVQLYEGTFLLLNIVASHIRARSERHRKEALEAGIQYGLPVQRKL
jgi:hypothetical protein